MMLSRDEQGTIPLSITIDYHLDDHGLSIGDVRVEVVNAFTPDQPAAPDEDAAVRAAAHDRLCRVMEGDNANEMGSRRQYANRILDAGWTDRRPVDTRPTPTETDFDNATLGIDWQKSTLLSYAVKARLLNAGIITPDPAPAAEVPVFASVEEATAHIDAIAGGSKWGVTRQSRLPADKKWYAWISRGSDTVYSGGSDGCHYATQLEALQALAAALTKATDR